jgi:Family of unknown function (DUF6011)
VSKYNWVRHNGTKLYEVGILDDGTLHNPRGYPDHLVREAVLAVDARRHERRSNAAKKAAVTRHRRQEKRVLEAAKRVVERKQTGPRIACVICGRGLHDQESIQRGIGSECWQGVLSAVERSRRTSSEMAEVTP